MAIWEYPYQVHKISINDQLEISYIDEGKGERVLLFIHGLGSNLKAWQKNIKPLSKDFRCIALDLPGYGQSSKNNYPYDMTFFAQAVRLLIESLALEEVILIGHSMGAQIATHIVLNNNDAIEKLILIAPAGFETFSVVDIEWFQSIYQPSILKSLTEERIIKNFELNFFNMPDDARFMIEDRLLMQATEAYDLLCEMIPMCVKGMLDEPIFEQLSTIQTPTLIFYGEKDQLIPNPIIHPKLTTLEVAQQGNQQIKNSQLVMIPRAGHFVQWECAAKINEKILQYIFK